MITNGSDSVPEPPEKWPWAKMWTKEIRTSDNNCFDSSKVFIISSTFETGTVSPEISILLLLKNSLSHTSFYPDFRNCAPEEYTLQKYATIDRVLPEFLFSGNKKDKRWQRFRVECKILIIQYTSIDTEAT